MRIVNNQVPTPFRDINLDMLLRPNYREYAAKALQLPLHLLGVARSLGRSLGSFSPVDLAIALADALPSGLYTGSGIEEYVRTVLSDPDRTDDFRLLQNELYLAATDLDTCERIVLGRRGLGRRADLHRRARLDRAADGLQAHRGQGPRADRRRHRLDHQPRHRGRGGREVRRRRQPARAVRQRLLEADPDAVRHARAPRLGHGLPEDRLPDVQAARLPAPARDGAPVGGALPGRRHRPDRARARRRADVRDEHPQLLRRGSRSPSTASSRSRSSSPRTTTSCATSASATASRSPPRACARSSSTSRPRRRRPAPGAGSSSRPPARCSGSPPRTEPSPL